MLHIQFHQHNFDTQRKRNACLQQKEIISSTFFTYGEEETIIKIFHNIL